jgi:Flp pilus assembly protein TadB
VSVVADRPASPLRRRLAAAAAVTILLAVPAGAAAGAGPRITAQRPTSIFSKTPSATTKTTPVLTKPKPVVTKPKPVVAKPKPVVAKPKPVVAKPKKTVAKPKKKKKAKPAVPLSGWRGSGSKFPDESLILSVPRNVHLTASQVHVSENGTPVAGFSLTPLAQAAQGDFGFVVAIDQSTSVTATELNQEMNAVRLLASQRRAGQELGLITFGGTPNVLLPLTNNSGQIDAALATTPPTSVGADAPAATALGLGQLFNAREAAGAVVVISDGNGTSAPDSAARAAVAAATAAHIPIVTLGFQDGAATALSLGALRRSAPGPFVSVTSGALAQQVGATFSSASTGYVVRYRSQMHPGQSVAVSASVDRTRGVVTADYKVPVPVSRVAKPVHHAPTGPNFANTSLLSSSPSFVGPPDSPAPAAASGFWGSSSSAAVIAGIAALLVAIAIVLIVKRPSQRAVRTRVGSFTAPKLETAEQEDPDAQTFPGLVRLLERGGFWPKFVEDVNIAQNPRTPVQLLKRAMIIGAVVALLLLLLTGTALYALLTLVATPLILRSLIARAARKQRERFRELLPMHLQDLAGAMRAGRSVVGALAAVAESADEPIKTELDRAIRDEQLGLPLEGSLEAIARRMEADDMDQVALVAALNRRSGSNVAEAFDRVAEGARERADLRREVKALTGQAKMSSWVLTGMPPMLLIGITVIAPVYAHPLLHTPIGLGLLVLSALMVFSGWKVMSKIINVKV